MNPLEQLATDVAEQMTKAREYHEKTIASLTEQYGQNVANFVDEITRVMLISSNLSSMAPSDPIIAPLYKEMLVTLCAHATDAYVQLYDIPREMVTEYMDMSKELARKVVEA